MDVKFILKDDESRIIERAENILLQQYKENNEIYRDDLINLIMDLVGYINYIEEEKE